MLKADCAHFIKQTAGPALGIYQMEIATNHSLWQNYIKYRPKPLSFMQAELPADLRGGKC